MSNMQYKVYIKEKVRDFTFLSVSKLKGKHKKVENLVYQDLKTPQKYLTDPKFSNSMVSLLFNMRCNTVDTFKDNFHGMYGRDNNCDLCQSHIDNQEHVFSCHVIIAALKENKKELLKSTRYEHIYGTTSQQFNVVCLFKSLMETRQRLLAELNERPTGAPIPDQ